MKTESEIIKDHEEFFRAIDRIKIAGFIALETRRDQLFFKSLNELNEILAKSLSLIVSNQNSYNRLFNPEGILSDEYDLDYTEIFSTDDPKKFDFAISKRSNEKNLISRKSVRYGFYSLVSAISSLRRECIKFGRIDLAETLNEGIIELLMKISQTKFAPDKHIGFLYELGLLIDDLVNQSFESSIQYLFLKRQGYYFWYLSCLYTEDFHFKKLLTTLDEQFFRSMKTAINQNESLVIESLAKKLIDGILVTDSNIEYNFIERREWGEKNRRRDLDTILHDTIYRSRSIYLINEYEEQIKKINSVWDELRSSITENYLTEFKNLIKHIERTIQENFIYNNIQINIIHILSYALHKEKYNLIYSFLNYNQPLGNSSSFANKDILPVNLNDLKELGIRRHSIEHRFFFLWENHVDNGPFLYDMLLILLARIYFYSRKEFNLSSINFNKGEKTRFQDFIQKVNQSKFDEILSEKVFTIFTLEFVADFKKAIYDLKSELDQDLQKSWLEQPVSPSIIDDFKKEVKKGIYSFPSLWNIYKKYKHVEHEKNLHLESRFIGVTQLEPKGYFVEDSGGVYVDWPNSHARLISENIEGFLTHELSKIAKREKCPKHRLLEILESLQEKDLSNKIIIAKNFRISYDVFRDVEDYSAEYVSTGFNVCGFVGTYKGIPVYEIFTRSSNWESMMLLDKSDMGTIIEEIPDGEWMDKNMIDGYEFFDIQGFAGNGSLIDEFIAEDVTWMRAMSEEEKVNKLKDSVSFRYFRKLGFEQPKVAPIIYSF
ncbi:MAG: hypothetical protein QE487_09330 [Fluviicola sp.]|nr:hypothetical protein [Fluviicola sp.]